VKYILISLLGFLLVSCGGVKGDRNLDNGIAIKGYDAVSYLDENKAEKGRSEFVASLK